MVCREKIQQNSYIVNDWSGYRLKQITTFNEQAQNNFNNVIRESSLHFKDNKNNISTEITRAQLFKGRLVQTRG